MVPLVELSLMIIDQSIHTQYDKTAGRDGNGSFR